MPALPHRGRQPRAYAPPWKYWRDVGRLDGQLYAFGRPSDETIAVGGIALGAQQTLWRGDTPDTLRLWQGFRSDLGVIVMSRLVMIEYTTPDDVDRDDHDPTADITGTTYSYGVPTRKLKVSHLTSNSGALTTDDTPDALIPPDALGVNTQPTREDYATLLAELSRGATGEFLVD